MLGDGSGTKPSEVYAPATKATVERAIRESNLQPVAFRIPKPKEQFLNYFLELETMYPMYSWPPDSPRIILKPKGDS